MTALLEKHTWLLFSKSRMPAHYLAHFGSVSLFFKTKIDRYIIFLVDWIGHSFKMNESVTIPQKFNSVFFLHIKTCKTAAFCKNTGNTKWLQKCQK